MPSFFKNPSQQKLIFLSSLAFVAFFNFSFFKNIINAYGISGLNFIYLVCDAAALIAFLTLFFTIFSSRYTTKPILMICFFISSFTAYFMDSYNVVIDSEMIRNAAQTNFAESADLFSPRLAIYVLVLGVLPCVLIARSHVSYRPLKFEILAKLKTAGICIVIIAALLFGFSKYYASFFREHKILRSYANPGYWIYSGVKFVAKSKKQGSQPLMQIATDAHIDENSTSSKKLVVVVVGEAARADRFSLNGYERDTNPLLAKEQGVVSLSNTHSCGTSTAQSVPCMFSLLNREEFSVEKAAEEQNVLDILNRADDMAILWRDNNSDSKGVALRVKYQNFKIPQNNPICDVECRDEGMLAGLDKFVAENAGKDVLIVLHQMGNHGPAYFKRYKKEFEKFSPVCRDNELENCSQQEISNAYDNAILYTDYFLSKVVEFLKPYSKTHETAMIYMSDHGESLGEGGVYLHGMPYLFAPEAQKHIGAIVWLGEGKMRERYDLSALKSHKDDAFSHDNLFHTLLGIFEVDTKVYNKDLDILSGVKN